jgi:geranylgeranyl diphosphate synthase, type II
MQNLDQFYSVFELFLKKNTFTDRNPQTLYNPINYILEMKGKRIRSLVTLFSYYLFDKDFEKALPAALSVELFHNFTLMHDDIMDKAALRRGNPTVHIKYGLNAAILSGDALMILAYQELMKVDAKYHSILVERFNKMALEVCEGQEMDIQFENDALVSIDEYIKMIELKTSVLLGYSFFQGAILGGATITEADNLYDFAVNLGIAFQIQDDYLDTFGDTALVGKKIGGDILQNKKTILYLLALDHSNKQQEKTLRMLYSTDLIDESLKLNQVLEIFEDLDIPNLVEKIKTEYYEKAIICLDKLTLDQKKKNALVAWSNDLMQRKY